MNHPARTRSAQRAARIVQMVAALVLATIIAVPVAAWAGHQFGDVGDANIFHDDIDWMKDTGVTKGCNPPVNDEYCPDDVVTREQMAAFMHRLETEGVLLPADGQATDAAALDGKDSSAYATHEELDEFIPLATISVLSANLSTVPSTTSHRSPVTAAPTFTRVEDGRYLIDLPGVSLEYSDHIATCTPVGNGPVHATYTFSDGDLLVHLFDPDGSLAPPTRDDFTCTVYKG